MRGKLIERLTRGRRSAALALAALVVIALAAAGSALALGGRDGSPPARTSAAVSHGSHGAAAGGSAAAADPDARGSHARPTRHRSSRAGAGSPDSASKSSRSRKHHVADGSGDSASHEGTASDAPADTTGDGSASGGGAASGGAPSDAEVRRELAQAMGLSGQHADASTDALLHQATLRPDGLVTPPAGAPAAVREIINGANQVARAPYVYGGGHGRWVDTAYDCSGSVSFALAAAGLLKTQLASTALEHFGRPGPGKWVTIYANAEHAWMMVAGVRFDTVGRAQAGSRWQAASRSTAGFVVRHPAGL